MSFGLFKAILSYVESLQAEDQNGNQIRMKKSRPRLLGPDSDEKRPYRRDYMQCQWWNEYINNPFVHDPRSSAGKAFRRRFRVSFPVFEEILIISSTAAPIGLGFELRPVSAAGIPGIPLELQILSVLRVLGRATCFDGIQEITGGSAEAHRTFFHEFCLRFSRTMYDRKIHVPESEEELRRTMSDYSRMGIPGAFGSTDCVHVRWDMCPASLTNICTGKEGYPTLAWQCTVNHKMIFMAVTKSFYGSWNGME